MFAGLGKHRGRPDRRAIASALDDGGMEPSHFGARLAPPPSRLVHSLLRRPTLPWANGLRAAALVYCRCFCLPDTRDSSGTAMSTLRAGTAFDIGKVTVRPLLSMPALAGQY